MAETAPEPTHRDYVSVDLAARVAGVSRNDMQRIAAEFDKGRTEPWCGAVLEVRRTRVLGRRHREIRIVSLPEPFRLALKTDRFRFRLAAEQIEPGAELTPPDFMLLHRAAHADFGAPGLVEMAVTTMCAGGSLLDVPRAVYELVVDNLYGYGFRDDALPGVSADYMDWLDAYRRHHGMGDRYYEALLIELAEVDRPQRIDGRGFIVLARHLMGLGDLWPLPRRDFMDREAVGILSEGRHQLGLTYDEFMRIVTLIGGGVHSVRDLDPSGWCRVRAYLLKLGYRQPEPAPRVPGAPGYIRQPQANLLARLAQDRPDWDPRSFGTLTAVGAGRLIDELLEPVIQQRCT